eukprot:15458336-Alexandrium_andersonii.AAC.1
MARPFGGHCSLSRPRAAGPTRSTPVATGAMAPPSARTTAPRGTGAASSRSCAGWLGRTPSRSRTARRPLRKIWRSGG